MVIQHFGARCQLAIWDHLGGAEVFSNIIRTNEDKIVMIDMRGQLGKIITTQGDVHYDLSKVFQSLCGYDFMLLAPLLHAVCMQQANNCALG